MSRRLDRWRRRLVAELPRVVVCRGGDCGSRRKHPGSDHAGQLARFREGIDPNAATVAVSKCLDECDHSNVVVVVPGRQAREQGAEQVWFGRVLDDGTTDAILDWAAAGDLRAAPPGAALAHRFEPGEESRYRLLSRS